MTYALEIRKKAQSDFDSIPQADAERITKRIMDLIHDLAGDVKRLKGVSPSYRLRVGDWRVLFEIEGGIVVIHRVLNRRDAYR
jgi:mRNA interferase RelE/StbE